MVAPNTEVNPEIAMQPHREETPSALSGTPYPGHLDPDWRERIERAKQVRRETLEARKDRQSTLEVILRAPL